MEDLPVASQDAQAPASAPVELASLFRPVRPARRPPVGSATTLSQAEQRYQRQAAQRARTGQPARPIMPRADIRRREKRTLDAKLYRDEVSLSEARLIVSTVLREFYEESMRKEEDHGGWVVRRSASARKNFGVAVALMVDKLCVLNGQPSQITEHRLSEPSPELQALARRLLALEAEGGKGGKGAS